MKTARMTCDSVEPGGGGHSAVNLKRICKGFARITFDNVDWGVINGQLGRDLQRPLQGLPLTMLILWGGGD